jgi:hypothetical protein
MEVVAVITYKLNFQINICHCLVVEVLVLFNIFWYNLHIK